MRRLLSHQAGLPVVQGPLSFEDACAWDPVIRALEAQKPEWQPGTEHVYDNTTFGFLAGELVRRVTGTSLGAVFAEEVAAPLGLSAWIGLPSSRAAGSGDGREDDGGPDGQDADARAPARTGGSGRPVVPHVARVLAFLPADAVGRARVARPPRLRGSLAFGDPDAGVGFGYVTNLWSFLVGEPQASNLAATVVRCLG